MTEGKEFGGPSPEDIGAGSSLNNKEGGADMGQKGDRMPLKEAQEEANMVKIIAEDNPEFSGDRSPSEEEYKAALDELENLQREAAEFRENEAKVLTRIARVIGIFPNAVDMLLDSLRGGDSLKQALGNTIVVAKVAHETHKRNTRGGDAGIYLDHIKDSADKIAKRDSENLARGEF